MTVRSENLVRQFLDDSGFDYEVIPCDPGLADTAIFCQHYGYALDVSANTIIVKAKTGQERFVACVVLLGIIGGCVYLLWRSHEP